MIDTHELKRRDRYLKMLLAFKDTFLNSLHTCLAGVLKLRCSHFHSLNFYILTPSV